MYPADVQQATALVRDRLNRTDLPAPPGWQALQARRAAKERPKDTSVPYLVPDTVPARALLDLSRANAATPSLALSRLFYKDSVAGVGVPLTRAWKDELAIWLFRVFEGGPAPRVWTATELNEHHPENSLTFWGGLRQRAGGRPVQYLSMEEVQAAHTLDTLLRATPPGERGPDALLPYLKWLNTACGDTEGYFLGSPAKAG